MDLRNAMFSNLVRLPTDYYDNHTSGSLISKFTFDVLQVTGAATSVISVLSETRSPSRAAWMAFLAQLETHFGGLLVDARGPDYAGFSNACAR